MHLFVCTCVEARPVTLDPQNPQQVKAQQLAIQAQELMQADKPFKARPYLEDAVKLWPESPYLHFAMAVCYTEVGEFERAIKDYEAALRLNPRMTDCFNNIASCYQVMGQPNQAIAWFEGYLRANPRGPDSARVKGMIVALQKSASRLVQANPASTDYLESIMPAGRLERWPQKSMPIKVFISAGRDEKGYPVPGFKEYYNDMIVDAFESWVKAANYRIGFIIVDDASIADIVCTWTSKRDFQGNSAEQGVAHIAARGVPGTNENQIVQVRVIVLIVDPDGHILNDQGMKKTCLHETGHALGFGGHSNNNRDVMFYSESPSVWASLTKRDRSTMARLYYDYPSIPPASDTRYGAAPAFPQNFVMTPTKPLPPSYYQPTVVPNGQLQQQNMYVPRAGDAFAPGF